ncbi:hypothetical protein [Bradyrhizobium manausense]|uniref:hypothetical protein n=1 Tax=Bradyrhizobium manausense TaxID=989370 RepID=UPI0012ED4C7B|nr:hypothetical protein [Bradyrhizobium manausense]
MDHFIHRQRLTVQWIAFAIPSVLVLFSSLFREQFADHPYIAFILLALALLLAFYLQVRVLRLDREGSYAQKLSVYRFASKPKIVTGVFYEEHGSSTLTHVNQCDTRAAKLVESELAQVGFKTISTISCSDDDVSPKAFSSEDVILICGPVGNSLSRELNQCLKDAGANAFYFSALEDAEQTAHRPKGKAKWIISHGLFGDLRITHPNSGNDDYGVIFVGRNPKAKDLWLVWLAGLGAEGTIGAARALVDPHVQAHIAEQLRSNDFVSALVKWKYERWDRGKIDSVLFSPRLVR